MSTLHCIIAPSCCRVFRRQARVLLIGIALALLGHAGDVHDFSAGLDAESRRCDAVVNDFSFGMYTQEREDGMLELRRHDPNVNDTTQLEYEDYEQCVRRLRLLDRGSAAKPRSFAVGRHHGNLLLGPNANSGFMILPALDFVVSAFVKMQGTYDEVEKDILSKLLRENQTAIEIGSNVGSYSVTLAEVVGPGGFLYAFEPFRKVFQILTANVALNGLGNVQTYQAGVGRTSERVSIRVPTLSQFTNLGAARVFLQQDPDLVNVPFEADMETVEVKRLDDMEWPRKIDFMKIDAEGMEEDVVTGAEQLILRDLPLLYVECQLFFDTEGDAELQTSFVNLVGKLGYVCGPIKALEQHQLLLCVHGSKYDQLMSNLRF